MAATISCSGFRRLGRRDSSCRVAPEAQPAPARATHSLVNLETRDSPAGPISSADARAAVDAILDHPETPKRFPDQRRLRPSLRFRPQPQRLGLARVQPDRHHGTHRLALLHRGNLLVVPDSRVGQTSEGPRGLARSLDPRTREVDHLPALVGALVDPRIAGLLVLESGGLAL